MATPNTVIYAPSQRLDPELRVALKNKITEYCKKNDLDLALVEKIVELIFDNFDLETGRILLPDLTATKPLAHLFHYSVKEYSIDYHVFPKFFESGVCTSVIDHFLRYGYIEILEGRRHSSLLFLMEGKI